MRIKQHSHVIKGSKIYILVSENSTNDTMLLENPNGQRFESSISKALRDGYEIIRISLPDPPEKGLGRNESRARLNGIKRRLEPFLDELLALDNEVKTLSVGEHKKYLLAVQRLTNFLEIKE